MGATRDSCWWCTAPDDSLIKPELGRRLFDAAGGPKAFVLVEGGSHHNTNAVAQPQYRQAITQLFGLQ